MREVILDVFGLLCLAVFAFILWPPAALLVVGCASLIMSWVFQQQPRGEDE